MKTSITFDAYKLSKFLESKKYEDLKTNALAQPMVEEYKKFIRSGKVKPVLSSRTKYNRKKKSSPGGVKPLFDTGRLANSIRYNKNKKGIYAVYYAEYHKDGNPSRNLPQRDFIDQTHKALGGRSVSKGGKVGLSSMERRQSSGMGKLIGAIRRVFSRRLAK
tara:strand:+ start:105 stop:590 length:486 start_codon:yes stop_codon:yes gene_type:complete